MAISRRSFLSAAAAVPLAAKAASRPNIVFVLTDDQGYGDLSIHGNTQLKTPHSDAIAREGVQFTQFQVCPCCSPTRSSLMTGRYNYRTGIVDTFLGRSMMYPDEVTIAEILSRSGYRTGIFGKWHLGDNYPMRAMDQGFQKTLVHRGGGIGQPADPPGNKYFDPILFEDGNERKYRGYCTDIFFDAAMEWIEHGGTAPYFAYISTNAPHGPLQVDEKYVAPFRAMGLPDDTAKIYGMLVNLDDNVGRLTAKLRDLGQERDTIFIFMTDNGPTGTPRFNGGMRGLKGSPYQGGIRVPCFVRWPARLKAGHTVDRIAAHIDILPTLLDACGVALPKNLKIDGRNLLPLAEGKKGNWPDRMLFTQWHRGDRPEPFRNCAVRTQQYKLVDGKELYDLQADPAEKNNLAAERPEVVARLRKGYEDWLQDVSAVRNYVPPRIYIGTPHENPVTLTQQDWRVTAVDAKAKAIGWWEVDVKQPGSYDVTMTIDAPMAAAEATIEIGATTAKITVEAGGTECRFSGLHLASGPARVNTAITSKNTKRGARYVAIRRGNNA